MLEAVEARDRMRADFRRQAKEKNLHLIKRVRFFRNVMASRIAAVNYLA